VQLPARLLQWEPIVSHNAYSLLLPPTFPTAMAWSISVAVPSLAEFSHSYTLTSIVAYTTHSCIAFRSSLKRNLIILIINVSNMSNNVFTDCHGSQSRRLCQSTIGTP